MSGIRRNPPRDPAAIEAAIRAFVDYSRPAIIPGRCAVDEFIEERHLKAALEVAIDDRTEAAVQRLLQKIEEFFRERMRP